MTIEFLLDSLNYLYTILSLTLASISYIPLTKLKEKNNRNEMEKKIDIDLAILPSYDT